MKKLTFVPKTFILFAVLIFLFASSPAYAKTAASGEISWAFLIIGLLGGLAFFLYGMEMMSEGMKQSAGDKMRSILATLTQNRVRGLLVGTFVTMIIQSSSATTVMLVSFVQSQLMTFAQTLGILLGAGLGTTITAQLIAFKLTDYALLMIAIGFAARLLAKNETVKNYADVILGFGILFYGMKLMSDSMYPLRTYEPFITSMKSLENPFLGIIAGAAFTALIQSSSAFIGILIVLGQQGLITLDASIPLTLGANIGTCVTAALASFGTSREAQRVAFAHIVFKITGASIFILWLPEFGDLIRKLADSFGSDIGRQIANIHTVFNVTISFIFLPFTSYFAKIITKLVPEKKTPGALVPFTTTLDISKIVSPAAAIELARAEISRMATSLELMLRAIAIPFVTTEPKRDKIYPELSLLEGVTRREEEVDYLEKKIGDYLIHLAKGGNSKWYAETVYGMLSIVKDMESIGDIIHRNVRPLINQKHNLSNDFSPEGREELTIYHEKVCKQIRLLKEAFAERDLDKARKIMSKEKKYLDLESKYRIKHLDRIILERQESIETHQVHMELMNLMTQIIVYTSNIAKTFLGYQDELEEAPENKGIE